MKACICCCMFTVWVIKLIIWHAMQLSVCMFATIYVEKASFNGIFFLQLL